MTDQPQQSENDYRNEYVQDIAALRREKDNFFAAAAQSPIPAEERRGHFAGLRYYPPDPQFRIEAEVSPFAHPEVVQLATSTGEIRPQLRYAELRFRIGDTDVRLTGFTDPQEHHAHELFVPFRDTTSGRETYGAGRYLEVELQHQPDGTHTATLDFNLAYNPYCAYSPYYSCPIPPAENTLAVAIPAGERNYSEEHQ